MIPKGMHLLPVPGDVDAAADPHLLVREHMVQEALQRRRPAPAGRRRQCRPTDIIFGAVCPSA